MNMIRKFWVWFYWVLRASRSQSFWMIDPLAWISSLLKGCYSFNFYVLNGTSSVLCVIDNFSFTLSFLYFLSIDYLSRCMYNNYNIQPYLNLKSSLYTWGSSEDWLLFTLYCVQSTGGGNWGLCAPAPLSVLRPYIVQ